MKSRGVRVQDGTEFYEQVTGKIPIESLRLGTLLFSSGFRLSHFLVIYKRAASIAVSIVGLILCLPLLPFVALAKMCIRDRGYCPAAALVHIASGVCLLGGCVGGELAGALNLSIRRVGSRRTAKSSRTVCRSKRYRESPGPSSGHDGTDS